LQKAAKLNPSIFSDDAVFKAADVTKQATDAILEGKKS
jgi:hypothetical protein